MRNFFKKDRLSEERGSTTVEFVLWVPIFTLMLITIMDASMLMLAQSRLYDEARTQMRLYTLGAISESRAEQDAKSAFDSENISAAITTEYVDDDPTNAGYATIEIELPTSDAVIFTSRFFGGATLKAEYSMVFEAAEAETGS